MRRRGACTLQCSRQHRLRRLQTLQQVLRDRVTFREALVIGDRYAADPNATSHNGTGRAAGPKRGYKPPGRRGRK